MGDKIVNYLFHIITHRGGSWAVFMILRQITGVNPIPKKDNGRFPHVMMHWLRWYTESGYYKNNDIYYNLV